MRSGKLTSKGEGQIRFGLRGGEVSISLLLSIKTLSILHKAAKHLRSTEQKTDETVPRSGAVRKSRSEARKLACSIAGTL